MKFYLSENAEVDLSPEISNEIIVVDSETFEYHGNIYKVKPTEFKIDDVYFLFAEMVRRNPNKKIFIHHFEPLANGFYAVYLAMEV